jgi:hypothetical protein
MLKDLSEFDPASLSSIISKLTAVVRNLPSPLGRGCPAAGAFISPSADGDG